MSKIGIKALALSYRDIENIAKQFRWHLKINGVFPADKLEYILEYLGCALHIKDDIKEEGFTNSNGSIMILRTDVYEKLLENEPRARFTATHELSHKLLHCNNNNLVNCRAESIPDYCNPEWQANALAGAILCPANEITLNMNCQDIMNKFVVSKECASIRLEKIKKHNL
jgi:Zn-dependent peptidase ImmA (M78 family)